MIIIFDNKLRKIKRVFLIIFLFVVLFIYLNLLSLVVTDPEA